MQEEITVQARLIIDDLENYDEETQLAILEKVMELRKRDRLFKRANQNLN